jgi:hypothetical protein
VKVVASSGRSASASMSSSVLLPLPLGPVTASTVPGAMSSSSTKSSNRLPLAS